MIATYPGVKNRIPLFRVGFSLILILFLAPGNLFGQTSADEETEKIRNLFQKYRKEKTTLEFILYELDHLENKTEDVISPILESDVATLRKKLAPDRLREKVLPDLRNRYRQLRSNLLSRIRDKEKYGKQWTSRPERVKIARKAAKLRSFFRKPFRYYVREQSDIWIRYFRARVLVEYIDPDLPSETDRNRKEKSDEPEGTPAKILVIYQKARSILHRDSVGLHPSLQPFLEENKSVKKKNKTKKKHVEPEEYQLVREVNNYREVFGLRRLRLNLKLSRAARKHAVEMKEREYFSHFSPVEENYSVSDRVLQEGFKKEPVGENLGLGRTSPKNILTGWIRSPDHHRNMLKQNYQFAGAGKAGMYWAMNFGGNRKGGRPK